MNKELLKKIMNDAQHQKVLARITELMDAEDTEEVSNELHILALLASEYEELHYKIEAPDPVDAILFRMDQMGLKPKDMVQYLGSKSKVSEILNHKRPLTINMIRNLNKGLGIPADILLGEENRVLPEEIEGIDGLKPLIKEMLDKKYISFKGTLNEAKERAEELIRDFLSGITLQELDPMLCRQNTRMKTKVDKYAMIVWQRQVLHLAEKNEIDTEFSKENLSDSFFDGLKKLSILKNGPALAIEYLAKHGVNLVINENFSKTYLDGAAMQFKGEKPIIALTLRHDRIDNFWFSLFHELAHIALHFTDDKNLFLDDLDIHGATIDEMEKEADKFARDKLITPEIWAEIKNSKEPHKITEIAKKLQLHHAIIMGRIRFEEDNYKLFSSIVNKCKVREHFHGDL